MGIETQTIPLVRQVIYTTYSAFPSAGLTIGDLAWATDRKCLYRWSGSAWEATGISSRHGNYADIGDPANYPESSLYQADDEGVLYMIVTGAWTEIVQPPILEAAHVVTGSRAKGTVYQNTTGKTMLVVISVEAENNKSLTVLTDTSNPPTTVVAMAKGTSGLVTSVLTMIVYNNCYYELVESGTLSVLKYWVEYY